jgi:hypothetical protein
MSFSYAGGSGGGGGGAGSGMSTPDYSRMETGVNLFSPSIDTWVANRTGYLYYSIQLYHGGSPVVTDNSSTQILVDDKIVQQSGRFVDPVNTPAGGIQFLEACVLSGVLPIVAGMTIQLKGITVGSMESSTWRRTGYFIPSRYDKVVPSNQNHLYLDSLLTPDYSAMETINRINSNNGTWAVEKAGFVLASVTATWTGTSISGGSCRVYINDVLVGQTYGATPGTLANSSERTVYPVQSGDIVKLEIVNTSGATLVTSNFSCFFIPPKILNTFAPVVAENFENYTFVPNYNNRTQVINGTNQSYTITQAGFIYASALNTQTANTRILINGFTVLDGINAVSKYAPKSDIFSVLPGDVITTAGAAENSIESGNPAYNVYFMPGRWLKVRAPVVIEPTTTYDYSEIDTGQRWINGKKIWRKCASGVITCAANSDNTLTLLASGAEELVSYGGTWGKGNNDTRVNTDGTVGTGNNLRSWFDISLSTGSIKWWTNSPYARTGRAAEDGYAVWVEYTKQGSG